MIFKHTLSIVLASFNAAREFVSPAHRIFISLLLTPFLFANCARPASIEGNSTTPLVYAALGDSTGIGLGARNGGGYVDRLFAQVERKRPRSTLLNLSMSGATTDDVLDKQVAQLSSAKATLVTICVGANDLLRGREAKQFAENYERIVAKVKQPGRLIVMANLPDVASAPMLKGTADESLRLRLEQFNKAIEDIAGRHGVPLVDLYKLNNEKKGLRPEFFSMDGLHPSDLGYAQWAEAMWAVIEQAMQK